MANIDRLILANGEKHTLVDSEARANINEIKSHIAGEKRTYQLVHEDGTTTDMIVGCGPQGEPGAGGGPC